MENFGFSFPITVGTTSPSQIQRVKSIYLVSCVTKLELLSQLDGQNKLG